MAWYGGWRPYVPVAQRRLEAKREMAALRKRGMKIEPVEIEGRKIAKTFWGDAWCTHLESFSDFENRLPRGRTYVRNGSVCHLAIARGEIEAKVSGSEIYDVNIEIKELSPKRWQAVKGRCAGQIGSLLELLEGRLSDHVMEAVTDRTKGLFPLPKEISFDCDCPDWASMCKHVAAVLYGVGARLDVKPELLFELRGVDHEDLIDADAAQAVSNATGRGKSRRLAADSLSDIFGIDVDAGAAGEAGNSASKGSGRGKAKAKRSTKRKSTTKKSTTKKSTKKKSTKKKVAKKTAGTASSPTTKKKAKRKIARKKATRKKATKKKAVRKKK